MPDPKEPDGASASGALALVQREVRLVVVLGIVAVVAFLGTQRLANWAHETNLQAAEIWYQRGQTFLAAGAVDDGIEALRRALAADRASTEYAMALARALEQGDAGEVEEARRLLLGLRARAPESAEVNYRLARLAVRRDRPIDAVRYYNQALFGLLPEDGSLRERQIQLELADLLIAQGEREEAVATLAILARDADGDAELRQTLGVLYTRADDPRQALAQFTAAIDAGAAGGAIHREAAEAAMALGNFVLARTHFVAARDAGDDVAGDLDRVNRVVAADPLGSGLGMTTRVRRLQAGLGWAADRLEACETSDEDPGERDRAAADLGTFREQPAQDLRDTDVLALGIDLVARVASVTAACAPDDPQTETWTILGATRGVGP